VLASSGLVLFSALSPWVCFFSRNHQHADTFFKPMVALLSVFHEITCSVLDTRMIDLLG
jgi:hypothetical protein